MSDMNAAPAAPAPAGATPAAPAPAPVAPTPSPAPAAPANIDAPAPATPPAPAPAPASGEAAGATVDYEPTGNPGFDLFLGFVGKQGFAPDHPAIQAAEGGDFSLLKAELASKGIKDAGWEQIVAVGEREFAAKMETLKAEKAKTEATIHEAVGGVDNWNAIQTWAAENAEPSERVQVNAALAAGGIAAKAMAMYLGQLWKGTNPAKVGANGLPDGGTPPSPNGDALSPSAYAKEVAALHAKTRGRIEGTKEYAALQARAARYRG